MNNDNISNPLRRVHLSGTSRVERRCQQKSCNCNQGNSIRLFEFHIFLLRCIETEFLVRHALAAITARARGDAVHVKRSAPGPTYNTLTVTSTLLRVALEYAQVAPCVAFTMAWATSRSKPGR